MRRAHHSLINEKLFDRIHEFKKEKQIGIPFNLPYNWSHILLLPARNVNIIINETPERQLHVQRIKKCLQTNNCFRTISVFVFLNEIGLFATKWARGQVVVVTAVHDGTPINAAKTKNSHRKINHIGPNGGY